MTLTSLSVQHRAALAMLSTVLEQNRAYFEAFGYPSGKTCPHCNKEVFASIEILEQLANAPGAGLAHDHCHAIITLQDQLAKAQSEPKLTLVQLPNPQAQEDDPANPDHEPVPTPVPTPAPAPAPEQEPAKEDASACA
jgi:hypothetical protein